MVNKILSLISRNAHAEIVNPFFGSAGTDSPTLTEIIPLIISALLVVGTISAMGYLILGALKWIAASGDKNNLAIAKQQIMQALIGLFILLSVWAIANLVEVFFGVSITNLHIPGTSPTHEAPLCVGCETCDDGIYCCNSVVGECMPCQTQDDGTTFCII